MILAILLFLISLPAAFVCGIICIITMAERNPSSVQWARRTGIAVACAVITFFLTNPTEDAAAPVDASSSNPNAIVSSAPSTSSSSDTQNIPPVTPPTSTPEPTPKTEILFRDIPWGTSSSEALETLQETGSWYLYENTTIPYRKMMVDFSALEAVSNGGNKIASFSLQVGGYNVFSTELYFAYKVKDGKIDRTSDELYGATYSFDVVDHKTVYISLQEKLTELYGVGDESTSRSSGWMFGGAYSGSYKKQIYETTWFGSNGASVTLRREEMDREELKNYDQVILVYSSSNADDTLDNLQKALLQERTEEERKNAVSNGNDGL